MSVSKWRYTEECNGRPCPGDCDHCSFEPTDLINRADAIEAVCGGCDHYYSCRVREIDRITECEQISALSELPSADVIEFDFNKYQPRVRNKVNDGTPSADAVQGEWEDREVFNETDDDHIVEEWQSARCSVCGKYHTTPYMYYFDDFNYCPNCGARMKGGEDE